MRILFLTSGRDVPASRFRVQQYVPYLESRGHLCTVRPSRPEKYRGLPFLGNRLSEPLRIAFRAFEALQNAIEPHDVVFVERELLSSSFLGLERLFRRTTRRIVLDVDDALFLLNGPKFERLVEMADHVIAGNAALEEVIRRHTPHVSVIPTVVDTTAYRFESERHSEESVAKASDRSAGPRKTSVGWIGTAYNFRYLEPILPAIRTLAGSHPVELTIVAERPPAVAAFASLPMRFERWSSERESELVRSFDVGLMPLAEDAWSRYKCGAKLLQYMAAGIPSIASPVGANRHITLPGETGFLATSTDEWTNALRRLLDDEELRARMGTEARRRVEAEYSVARWAPVLERTLREVADRDATHVA